MINRLRNRLKKENGFTLIEMSLVLLIISVLLLLFVPNLSKRQESANDTGTDAIETVLQSQVDLYKIEEKKNPENFDVMKNEKYLTPNQADRANKDFQLNGGIVTKKAK